MYRKFYTTAMCSQKKTIEKRFDSICKEKRVRKIVSVLSAIAALILFTTTVFASGILQQPVYEGTEQTAGATSGDTEQQNTGVLTTAEYDALQLKADRGEETWRRDAAQVAADFVRGTLKLEDADFTEVRGDSRVVFTQADGTEVVIDVYQPSRKGEGGIWAVQQWFSSQELWIHTVRNWADLPPLFHGDDTIPQAQQAVFRDAIETVFTQAYSPYYEVLGFEASNIQYRETDTGFEATMVLSVAVKRPYQDPDSVSYIREAKESGSADYEILYQEYNQPQVLMFEIRAVADRLEDGTADQNSVQLYGNISPQGVEWAPIEEFFV